MREYEDVVDLIFRASFISLATVDVEGLPWVSPLEFVCDEDANVYWISRVDARHSANLRSNPRAALAIFDSGQVPGVGRVDGLYAEGSVDKLDPGDVGRIMPSIERWLAWRDAKRAEPRPPRPSDSVW